ncbi:hypothetical protein BACCIP111895_02175 [Neobacillus rhizosphaerae]|uniref:Xylose isomerase-like TIM barrel domain-containing protein n=1 Tax=Neobacillus rhizosphaerae TaxID=2880965 RepID=A0ABN8KRH8_9BACI|nr:hypothetical protein [Neobacillus rhizosphaerae]CAH2714998.1 hypothetical protein BACCIP111895_02175 [Neobacillus rhizosphaerae]
MQYSTYKAEFFDEKQYVTMDEFCVEYGLDGMEVFMDDMFPRDQDLYDHKEEILLKLRTLNVRRIHCSYWAYPTSFLTKNHFNELVERFGGQEEVARYYGDLTGVHMFKRWAQEYQIATELKAHSYIYHLIDYAPIDGKWEYTISKADIRQAMIYMIQQFLNYLMDRKLLTEDSPSIEVENAGWGLEHGLQTAEDYKLMYSQLYDPFQKVKIGWDINHLLHALGFDEKKKCARFFLPDSEISARMVEMQQMYGNKPNMLAEKWLEYNILDLELVKRVGCLHLSDCVLKTTEFFRNGKLTGHYYEEIVALDSWDMQENYGVDIVLSAYDSHLPLGDGTLDPANIKAMILKIYATNPDLAILHELKNNKDQNAAIRKQLDRLDLN